MIKKNIHLGLAITLKSYAEKLDSHRVDGSEEGERVGSTWLWYKVRFFVYHFAQYNC